MPGSKINKSCRDFLSEGIVHSIGSLIAGSELLPADSILSYWSELLPFKLLQLRPKWPTPDQGQGRASRTRGRLDIHQQPFPQSAWPDSVTYRPKNVPNFLQFPLIVPKFPAKEGCRFNISTPKWRNQISLTEKMKGLCRDSK